MYRLKLAGRICELCAFGALAIGLLAPPARAQVVPAAYGPADTLWVGAEYSNIDASFPYQSGDRLAGVGAFADFNVRAHLGLEGDARFMQFGGYQAETERTLLGGPRYRFNWFGKFQPYAQGLIGVATIQYPFKIGQGELPGGGAVGRGELPREPPMAGAGAVRVPVLAEFPGLRERARAPVEAQRTSGRCCFSVVALTGGRDLRNQSLLLPLFSWGCEEGAAGGVRIASSNSAGGYSV